MTRHRRRMLTPHEIRTARLRTIGLRKGYEPNAVHQLLQRLAEETASRDEAIGDLTSRLHRAEVEAYARRHGALPAASSRGNLDDLLGEIDLRMKAQRYADEVIAAAQHGAAQIVEQGRQQASQVMAQAHVAAEQAAHAYRERAGGGHLPEREELARLLGVAQWAQAQLAGLHEQVRAADATVGKELESLAARLSPLLAATDNGWVAPPPSRV